MIREADHLMAEAIRIVAGLYEDGMLAEARGLRLRLPRPADLPRRADARSSRQLFVMFLEHRMRAFQGTFHANPDYALWYGWSEMVRDLTEIKQLAKEMREREE